MEYRIEGKSNFLQSNFSVKRKSKRVAIDYAKGLVERYKQDWLNIFWQDTHGKTRGISVSRGRNGKAIVNKFIF